MSVAQPMLDFIDSIEEKPKDFILTLKAFRKILKFHKPYLPLVTFYYRLGCSAVLPVPA